MRIPKTHHEGFRRLIALTNEGVEELARALEALPSTLDSGTQLSQVLKAIPSMTRKGADEILRVLISLCVLRARSSKSTPEFLEEVCVAVEAAELDDPRFTPDNRETFKESLRRFLDIRILSITAKAGQLLLEHDNVLCAARVLTDIRPVFGADASGTPEAAVIVHVLKISYHHAGELDEVYVALDTSDVKQLRAALDRADAKAKSLRAVLATSKVPYLDIE